MTPTAMGIFFSLEDLAYLKNWFPHQCPTVSNTQYRESLLAGVPSSTFFSMPHSCLVLFLVPLISCITLSHYTISFTLNLFLHNLLLDVAYLPTTLLQWTWWTFPFPSHLQKTQNWRGWECHESHRGILAILLFFVFSNLSSHIKWCFFQSLPKCMPRLRYDDPRASGW